MSTLTFVDLVQGAVAAIMSLWTEIRKGPVLSGEEQMCNESATEVLSYWAAMQRIPQDQMDQSLWLKLDGLVRSDVRELIRRFELYMDSKPLATFSDEVAKLKRMNDREASEEFAMNLFRLLDDVDLACAAVRILLPLGSSVREKYKQYREDVKAAECCFRDNTYAFRDLDEFASWADSTFQHVKALNDTNNPLGDTTDKYTPLWERFEGIA